MTKLDLPQSVLAVVRAPLDELGLVSSWAKKIAQIR